MHFDFPYMLTTDKITLNSSCKPVYFDLFKLPEKIQNEILTDTIKIACPGNDRCFLTKNNFHSLFTLILK